MEQVAEKKEARKKDCLIVEDNETNRVVAVTLVKRLGLNAIEVDNGKKALEICDQSIPDVILLDWYMPEMDGLEFIKEFKKIQTRKNPERKAIIIMCSGEDKKNKVGQAVMAGADNYILKPIDLEKLRKKFLDTGVL